MSNPAPVPLTRVLAGVIASAVLSALYARGGPGWLLGFVVFVPWLCTLTASRSLAGTLLSAYLMSLAFTGAAFAWFGIAIGSYTQVGGATGLSVLLLAAPLFQPQFIAFAVVRHLAGRRYGPVAGALAAAAAWVATEWLLPKVLGDTLGHGLYPSRLLRQGADVGGAAGLTLLLLLTNEGIAAALARWRDGMRAMAKPLALAALAPLILASYGLVALSADPAAAGKPLRMGLVQANIVDYEDQRLSKGALAVVRDVLDTHFAMSYDAVERQHAHAVLWSETIYPTTFGHPKSEVGAALDREILGIAKSAGVPFVFGTYDSDAAGEYNAAAFVQPETGLLGFYRKTRLFPLTEYVPAWLDGPTLRQWLPWTGRWQAGNGARVFPLRLADGREIPVQAMICLDDVDSQLAIDGARLGAQAILTMSNDSWFTGHPQGAQLHQAVAAFRSIETRLPQFRVTTNGFSAVIDATGSVIAGARMGERTLVMGEVAVGPAQRTLMVSLGNWVGPAGVAFLALLAAIAVFPSPGVPGAQGASESDLAMAFPAKVAVLPPAARWAAGLLRAFARGNLLWMGAAILLGESLRANTLAQMRMFTGFFLVPEAIAACLMLAFAARASIENGMLVLTRGAGQLELALSDIAAVTPWRVPLPGPGVTLLLVSGGPWRYGLALANPTALAPALALNGAVPAQAARPTWETRYAQTRQAMQRTRLDHPFNKFVLLPVALALPAFRLHQHIAYGGSFGEYYSFGLKAYLTTFSIWWAAWAIGVVLTAAALRAVAEAGTLIAVLLRPEAAINVRRWLERLALATLYLGLPTSLLLRAFGG